MKRIRHFLLRIIGMFPDISPQRFRVNFFGLRFNGLSDKSPVSSYRRTQLCTVERPTPKAFAVSAHEELCSKRCFTAFSLKSTLYPVAIPSFPVFSIQYLLLSVKLADYNLFHDEKPPLSPLCEEIAVFSTAIIVHFGGFGKVFLYFFLSSEPQKTIPFLRIRRYRELQLPFQSSG